MNNSNSIEKKIQDENGSRILTVKWNEYIIGYLIKEKDGSYLYKYDKKGLQDARKHGYNYIIGFKDTRKVYSSDELFPVFKSRVPSKQRRNLKSILADLGIEKYDEFDLLSLSGGELLTDRLSFKEYHYNNITRLNSHETGEKEGEVNHGR